MVDLKRVVGKEIRRLRGIRGYSQEELADRCGLHRTYIGGVERGERNMTLNSLMRIADALGVAAADLIGTRKRNVQR